MSLQIIEKLLYDAMGLNSESIGSSAVLRSIEQRMLICKIPEISAYRNKIVADKNELQELIEEVVVTETWFFRDKRPFQMLSQYLRQEWLPSNPNSPIRLLSLPCATGEEPYSIAITLLEAGLMPSQLKIDAFDISERNIKRCLSARYKENSFRGVDNYIKDKFFNFKGNAYHPDILIKSMVTFDIASILDLNFISLQDHYDVVFCRNLLIYFDRKTQATAAEMLGKLLKKDGLLFVGHAETTIFTKNWYLSERYPKSYIMRKFFDGKISGVRRRKKIENPVTRIASKVKPTPKNLNNQRVDIKNLDVNIKSIDSNSDMNNIVSNNYTINPSQSLAQAQKLADNGKLIEAEESCLNLLESNKNNIQVYYLLAIIQLASGDAKKSAGYFKNVVYLDPNHYEALMYLSTLMHEQGDDRGATRFRERAARIKKKLIAN